MLTVRRRRADALVVQPGHVRLVLGFIRTLRRTRTPSASARTSVARGERARRDPQRATGRPVLAVGHPALSMRADAASIVARRVRRDREVGDDVELRLAGTGAARRSRAAAPAHARAARTPAARTGRAEVAAQRRVSQSAAAAAPAREHSRLISPRCSSAEVK